MLSLKLPPALGMAAVTIATAKQQQRQHPKQHEKEKGRRRIGKVTMDKITTKAYYGLKGGQTDGTMEGIVPADNANNISTKFRTFKECLNHTVYIQNSLNLSSSAKTQQKQMFILIPLYLSV